WNCGCLAARFRRTGFQPLSLPTSLGFDLVSSQRDDLMVAVGFIPRIRCIPVDRVAERRLNAARISQSSLRDEGTYGVPNRGLKATATIRGSLRDPDWQIE